MKNFIEKVKGKSVSISQGWQIFHFLKKDAVFSLETPLYKNTLLKEIFICAAEDDFVYPDLTLPSECFLKATSAEIEDGYRINWQLFQKRLNWRELKNLALSFGFGAYPLSDKKMQDFKDIRACGKNFRFACHSFDQRHSSPFSLRIFLWVMGELKDSVSYKCRAKAIFFSLFLWVLCVSPLRFFLRLQAMDFKGETAEGLAEFHQRENRFFMEIMKQNLLTAHEFHDLRKIISRRVFFVDTLWVLSPKRDLRALDHYLATLNGLMGARHDRFVFQSAWGGTPYRRAKLQFPPLCRYFIRRFLFACCQETEIAGTFP